MVHQDGRMLPVDGVIKMPKIPEPKNDAIKLMVEINEYLSTPKPVEEKLLKEISNLQKQLRPNIWKVK